MISFMLQQHPGSEPTMQFTRLSRYFMPTVKTDHLSAAHQLGSKSAELLFRAGYIRPSSAGIYNILPLGERVLSNLITIIDEEMYRINAQKCSLSLLQSNELWTKTGRSQLMAGEIFSFEKSQMLLAPTHEEEITHLVAQNVSSYRQLPLRLFQIGPKFRNEARPKGGLLRCREFLMKDLYTFDATEQDAISTYNQVCEAYSRIFERLELRVFKAKASSGAIGGNHSHEFHIACQSGQDTVLHCNNCRFVGNSEVFADGSKCPQCSSSNNFSSMRALEVGHTFLLGEKYSQILDAKFNDQTGQQKRMQMGCYGIGVSRLMAAIVEASHDEQGIIWPRAVSPFQAYVIPLTSSSVGSFSLPSEFKNCLLDDRENISFSRKFKDAQLSGLSSIIILGSKRSADGIEVYSRRQLSDNKGDGTA